MDKDLNEQQLEAINFGEGPLLIIAGAGTGKTTVITERIKHLILDKNIDPANLVALTFTEKAATEMQERVDIALPYGYSQMWIDTFHGFCEKILRDEALNIGLDSSFKLLTESEAVLFIRRNLEKFDFDYFKPLGNPNKLISSLLFHFSRLKDEDISPIQYLQWAKQKSDLIKNNKGATEEEREEVKKNLELANLYNTYQELKNKNGFMDFSDLVFNTLALFRQRKNILKKYQDKFQYILIDEFQDTNYLQNELAILLSNNKQNINVVGDDDQAVYRWRGAAVSNMISFREKFPNAQIVTLTKNYRSTQIILDSAYKLIKYNDPDRLEVKENINKKLISQIKKNGNDIQLIYTKNDTTETEKVLETILKLKKEKKYNYKDFAILVRANDYALPFIKTFERNKIPYQFLGTQQLFNQEEIKDLIAFLKVTADPNDSASIFRLLNINLFKINNFSLISLFNFAKRKNLTIFEALENSNKLNISEVDKEKLNKVYDLVKNNLEKLKTETPGQILYFFLQETGMLENFLNDTSNTTQLKAQNVARFFEKIKLYEDNHIDNSIQDILDWIDLSMQVGEGPTVNEMAENEIDGVNILTVHSSKGLEFPVVFIVNLVTNRFPTLARREQIPVPDELIKEILPSGNYHLEEERRLFYVAMTRARDYLYFSSSKFYSEGKRERKISPFVIESLGEEKVNKVINQEDKEKKQLSLLDFELLNNSKIEIIKREKLNLSYLSYSQFQTFDFCNMHYRLKYILKIPTQPTQSLSFGSSLHATLRDFYLLIQNGKTKDEIDLESIYKKNWLREGYNHKKDQEKYYNLGLNIIKDYLENNFNENIKSIVETPFKFFLNNLCIGGIIDRIDFLPDGTIEIIDYKTGNNLPDEKKLSKNLQLTIYALALMSSKTSTLPTINDPEKIKLSLYYLEKNKKLSITKTREELEDAKAEILDKIKEIENSEFNCTGGMFCKDCEYKMICKTTS